MIMASVFIACDTGSSGSDTNKGRFYADYISFYPSAFPPGNIIDIAFYSYSGDGHYDGTIENIRNNFTVSINGQAVRISSFEVDGTGIRLFVDGTYVSGAEYFTRVAYRADSPNRLWVEWNGKNYIGNFTFEGNLKFELGAWVNF